MQNCLRILISSHPTAEYGNASLICAQAWSPLSGSYSNTYKDSCGAFIRPDMACAPLHPAWQQSLLLRTPLLIMVTVKECRWKFLRCTSKCCICRKDLQNPIDIGSSLYR